MAFSPMMTHYLQTKEEYKDCIVLYRLGDFYEMFFDDAVKASNILDLVLTGRDCGDGQRAPMCGVPYHAVDAYISKLIESGCKVAICEQLEDPRFCKGMVDRGVIRVVTPGTVMEGESLQEKHNNFLASLTVDQNTISCAFCDISTGELFCAHFEGGTALKQLQEMLVAYTPSEIISDTNSLFLNDQVEAIKRGQIVKITPYYDWAFDFSKAKNTIIKQYNINTIDIFDLNSKTLVCCVGALISYLIDTQKRSLAHLMPIKVINDSEYMSLDLNTRKNLELTNSKERKKGSLLWLLDKTQTGMGARMLYSWIERPLQSIEKIDKRLDAVEEFCDNYLLRETIDKMLSPVKDIERLTARISYNNISPRDCNALQLSLQVLPEIKSSLILAKSEQLSKIRENLVDLTQVERLLFNSIVENAPAVVKDGGFIKQGYNAQLDNLKSISRDSKGIIAKLEESERERTGIKNLKVGFNRVFGYYFEISNSFKSMTPVDYIRKQTLTNGERFVSPELKELEETILTADEKSLDLEKSLFCQLREQLLPFIPDLQKVASNIAQLDALLSFAKVSLEHNYSKPKLVEFGNDLKIEQGRHPLVECFLPSGQFIANDVFLNNDSDRAMVITGPNMAGKSTYMRQVALIVLMAHIGCFVPAQNAQIPLVDKIFTRVGASDDLSFNQSTFMVEMVEVAYILNNATPNSLIILDEVGRGTSTFDGLSIAWAVLEYLASNIRAKTLFATHYHELTELEGNVEGVKNYKITVKEVNDTIVFLRKITRGGANKSFGIEVASLAGVRKEVIERAKIILSDIEKANNGLTVSGNVSKDDVDNSSDYAKNQRIVNYLQDVNVNNITPLQAFDILCDLCAKVKK